MFGKKDSSKSPRDTGGPVVKTGPTRGENRSRNDNGEWRKKRSDAGRERKKSGCFLTTAACVHRGLPDDCYELEVLRSFRDDVLLTTEAGRTLVFHYYNVAPAIAEKLTNDSDLNFVWLMIQKCIAEIDQYRYFDAISTYRKMTESIGFRLLGEGLSVARVDINLLAELSPAVDHRIAQPFNFTLSSNGCPLKNPIDS